MSSMISRPISEGFRGVARHWAMSISSIIAVTTTLIIISLFLIFSYHMQLFTKSVESSMQIYAGVDYDYEDDEDRIRAEIEALDEVKTVKYYTKDEEYEFFLSQYDDEQTREVFSPYKEDNPLHDAFYVEAKDGKQIQDLSKKIGNIEGIYMTNYGGQSTVNMVSAMSKIRRFGGFLVIFLGLLAIFLIQNTIKLTIYARQDEIAIMRNVGATNSFIRAPFVMEGIITGTLGALVPIALTIYGYYYVYEKTGGVLISNMFRLVRPNPFVLYLAGILLAIGVLVGLIGSFMSVTRYLRWKR